MSEEIRQFNLIYTLPMRTITYHSMDGIEYPCYLQPFTPGIRCLYNPMRGFWNEKGIPFKVNLGHLKWESVNDITLDGVLTLPQSYTYRQTVSATTRQNKLTPLLEYRIFDMVLYGTFEGRWDTFWQSYWDDEHPKYENKPDRLMRTLTYLIDNSNELEETVGFLLDRGIIRDYVVLRLNSCEYKMGQKNRDVRKVLIDDLL